MKTPSISTSSLVFVFFNVIILSFFPPSHSSQYHFDHDFIHCLNNSGISGLIYTPSNSSYASVLESSIQNLRFTALSTLKPFLIVTPLDESQIQSIVLCSKKHGVHIRIRSGGHDFEGLSYRSQAPDQFVIVDLINLSEIKVDVEQKTAWVGSGAIIGQLYYEISQASKTLGFAAGVCPTVGVGGHFSGGGYGHLLRKYGLAADNAIDARIIDVNGKILDRKSMGEDLFWAIRGGGSSSFGVITAWKVNLNPVPEVLTGFRIIRILEQDDVELIHKWQYVAPNLPKEYYFSVVLQRVNSTGPGKAIQLQATFDCMFLGGADKVVELFKQRFPKLGVKKEDCVEMSWIQSVLFFWGYPVNTPTQVLTSRTPVARYHFKGKSDYVREPIPVSGLKGLWELLNEEATAQMFFVAYGGRMSEIPESASPFPHRAGNLYQILNLIQWNEAGLEVSWRHTRWSRKSYRYMAPYVSKSPRRAYMNYRDLDIGANNEGNTSVAQASVWARKYYNNNFKRLVKVKTKVDPANFFRNEQSIPPLYIHMMEGKMKGSLDS